ncbi:MAG: hypothetical protein IKC64_04240, partial [Clostridia bacterium]|nr:hypothetical protein [Clostridia bacterium]
LKNSAIAKLNTGSQYTKAEKDAIKKLSDIALKLTERNAEKNVDKYEDEVDEAKEQLGSLITAPVYDSQSMIGTIDKYLVETMTGIERMKEKVADDVKQVAVLEKCKEKLAEIRLNFNVSVWDNISEKACAYEKAIIEKFTEVRKQLYAHMATSETSAMIDEIGATVDEWAKLKGVERRNGLAKKDSVVTFSADKLSHILISELVYEKVTTFVNNVLRYVKDTEKISNTEKEEAEIRTLEEKNRAINEKLDDLAIRQVRGPVDLSREINQEQKQLVRNSELIKRLRGRIADIDYRASLRDETVTILEKIMDVFEFSKFSPILVYEIFKKVDFVKIMGLLDVTSDPETLKDTVKEIYSVFIRDQLLTEQGEVQRDNIRGLLKVINQIHGDRNSVSLDDKMAEISKENETQHNATTQWALERIKQSGIGQVTTTPVENVTQTTEVNPQTVRNDIKPEDY